MARRSDRAVDAMSDAELLRELERVWAERPGKVFNGDADGLRRITARMEELEGEYAARHTNSVQPDPHRSRKGARARSGQQIEGGVPRAALKRKPANARSDDRRVRGAGDGYERRQGTRRRETFENMREGKAFSRHTIGTTGDKQRGRDEGRARPRRPSADADVNRRTTSKPERGAAESVPVRARGGRRTEMTYASGKTDEGKRTGRGRGVPGLPGSFGRKGGASRSKGAANRAVGRPSRSSGAANARTGGRRRPKSGTQG